MKAPELTGLSRQWFVDWWKNNWRMVLDMVRSSAAVEGPKAAKPEHLEMVLSDEDRVHRMVSHQLEYIDVGVVGGAVRVLPHRVGGYKKPEWMGQFILLNDLGLLETKLLPDFYVAMQRHVDVATAHLRLQVLGAKKELELQRYAPEHLYLPKAWAPVIDYYWHKLHVYMNLRVHFTSEIQPRVETEPRYGHFQLLREIE